MEGRPGRRARRPALCPTQPGQPQILAIVQGFSGLLGSDDFAQALNQLIQQFRRNPGNPLSQPLD
jgi:hypothetical protein